MLDDKQLIWFCPEYTVLYTYVGEGPKTRIKMVIVETDVLYLISYHQDVMSPEDLVRITQCGCTIRDVARMENIILQKLGWDLEAPTPLSFLQLFHAYCVVLDTVGTDAGRQTDHLDIMTRKLEACMCHFPLTIFKVGIMLKAPTLLVFRKKS